MVLFRIQMLEAKSYYILSIVDKGWGTAKGRSVVPKHLKWSYCLGV